MKKSELGRLGERLAARYLSSCGYEILSLNYRSGHLETDIICADKEHTVFVEVKTRTPSSLRYGRPAAAVDEKKRQNLVLCAEAYIRERRALGENVKRPRIDVVEVYIDGDTRKIKHIKNAVLDERG